MNAHVNLSSHLILLFEMGELAGTLNFSCRLVSRGGHRKYYVLHEHQLYSTVTSLIFGVRMNNKIIGIVLIVVGVALAIWGYNVYDSAGSQITRALSGDTPIEAWVAMVSGVIAVLVGITKVK